MRLNKPKHHSLEQRMVYCWAQQGEWVAHAQHLPPPPNSSIVLGEKSFILSGKIWSEGCRVYVAFFWLVGNEVQGGIPVILCSSLKLASSTWVGHSSYRTQRYYCVCSLRRNQAPIPKLHYCFFFKLFYLYFIFSNEFITFTVVQWLSQPNFIGFPSHNPSTSPHPP